MRIKKIEHQLFKTIKETLVFTGDAVGLAALKLGHEAFAYKTITTLRKKSECMEVKFDGFIEDNIEKVKVRVTEADLQNFKEKVKEGIASVKDLGKDMKEGKNIFVTEETRIYGDAQHFYEEEDMVFGEEGIILEKILLVDDPEDI